LGKINEEDKGSIVELHQFWKAERKGLYNFLRSEKFAHLFDENQSHIQKEDLDNSLGLYILLKTAPNITAKDILIQTGVLGVDTRSFKIGNFVRFSTGTIVEPTYSKYS
jgi:hypothetical protein